MICLVPIFCLLHFVHCQEAPLLECSPNFYRDEDSVCRFCDENACKAVLERKDLLKCSPSFYRDEDLLCRICDVNACRAVLGNKGTKYEDCRPHCPSKTSSRPYPTFTRSKEKGTRQPYDIPESNKWIWFLIPGFLTTVIINIILGVVMSYGYKKYERKDEVKSVFGYIKAVLMTGIKTGCYTSARQERLNNRNAYTKQLNPDGRKRTNTSLDRDERLNCSKRIMNPLLIYNRSNSLDTRLVSDEKMNNCNTINNLFLIPNRSNSTGTPLDSDGKLNDSNAIKNQLLGSTERLDDSIAINNLLLIPGGRKRNNAPLTPGLSNSIGTLLILEEGT